MKVDAREFDEAFELLNRVGNVGPDRMAIYRYAIAYVNLQRGNLDRARLNVEAARTASTTPAQTQAADRMMKLIDARSKGPAEAHPGEALMRAKGTALGLRCAAAGSAEMSKMGITIDGKQILFDMPDPAAVEIARSPAATPELKCGALPPFPIVWNIRHRALSNRWQSAGIIRWWSSESGLISSRITTRASIESHSPLHHILNGLRVDDVLLRQDARGQRTPPYRASSTGTADLNQDWPRIQKLIDQMDSAAGDSSRRVRAPGAARRGRETPGAGKGGC